MAINGGISRSGIKLSGPFDPLTCIKVPSRIIPLYYKTQLSMEVRIQSNTTSSLGYRRPAPEVIIPMEA